MVDFECSRRLEKLGKEIFDCFFSFSFVVVVVFVLVGVVGKVFGNVVESERREESGFGRFVVLFGVLVNDLVELFGLGRFGSELERVAGSFESVEGVFGCGSVGVNLV